MAEIKVTGLKELQQRLKEIGSVSGTKVMRSAMFTATKPILDRAKATAPKRSGALQVALTRTYTVDNKRVTSDDVNGARFSILVGPKTRNRTAIALYNLVYRRKKPRRGIFYGHFLEFGTKTGTHATNWLRRALESTSTTVTELLASTLKKRIETAARKR